MGHYCYGTSPLEVIGEHGTLAKAREQMDRVKVGKAARRDAAIRAAYACGTYRLAQIGDHFGLHYATVSRIARREG